MCILICKFLNCEVSKVDGHLGHLYFLVSFAAGVVVMVGLVVEESLIAVDLIDGFFRPKEETPLH